MIKASDYLPRQLNGEFATMLFECLTKPLADTDEMLWSMYEYSIDTAVDENLDLIGQFIGFPRPLIPENLIAEDAFTFLQYNPAVEKDESQGFASVSEQGGARFLSTLRQNANRIGDNWYRLILKGYAYLKWHGGTFDSIGYIMSVFCKNWGIYIANENNKSIGNILLTGEGTTEPTRYLLEQIFDGWSYCPQISVEIGYPIPMPTEVDGWKPLLLEDYGASEEVPAIRLTIELDAFSAPVGNANQTLYKTETVPEIRPTDEFEIQIIKNTGEVRTLDLTKIDDRYYLILTDEVSVSVVLYYDYSNVPPEYHNILGYFVLQSDKFSTSEYLGGEFIIKVFRG